MGCDIHDYLEVRRDGRWEYAGDEAFPENEYDWEKRSPFGGSRSYGLFGFLAGVRNYSCAPVLAAPRGLPEDVSAEVTAGCEDRDWYHSYTWFTLRELLDVDYGQAFEDRRVSGGGEMTTLREFLGEWYFGRLELMGRFGAPEHVRVIAWFDN